MAKRKSTLPKQGAPERRKVRVEQRGRGNLLWIGGAVAVVALAIVAVLLLSPSTLQAAPGEAMPIQGRDHIAVGATHPAYNSDPPTSGWHYDTPLATGFYETPYPDEQLIHNLEHGHIVISYDCSKLTDCEETKAQLRQIFRRYNGWKVTIVPRQNADTAIALTAWGRIDKLDAYDQARIERFINAWRNHGPEQTME